MTMIRLLIGLSVGGAIGYFLGRSSVQTSVAGLGFSPSATAAPPAAFAQVRNAYRAMDRIRIS